MIDSQKIKNYIHDSTKTNKLIDYLLEPFSDAGWLDGAGVRYYNGKLSKYCGMKVEVIDAEKPIYELYIYKSGQNPHTNMETQTDTFNSYKDVLNAVKKLEEEVIE